MVSRVRAAASRQSYARSTYAGKINARRLLGPSINMVSYRRLVADELVTAKSDCRRPLYTGSQQRKSDTYVSRSRRNAVKWMSWAQPFCANRNVRRLAVTSTLFLPCIIHFKVRETKAFQRRHTSDGTTKLSVKKCYARSFGIDLYERMALGTAGFMLHYYRGGGKKNR